MKLAALLLLCAPALAVADDAKPDDPKPRPEIVVDAPVHENERTDKPDPRAVRAGEEANVLQRDPHDGRQGFFLHSGIGPSITIGGGTGTGGGGTLLLGTTVRESMVALLSFTVNAQRHEVMNKVETNDYSSIGLGVQWWPNNGAVHARATFGIGGYRCKQCSDPDEPTNPVLIDYQRRGVNGTFAVGIDLYRTSFGLVWGLDTSAIMTIHTEPGVITALGFQSYLSID